MRDSGGERGESAGGMSEGVLNRGRTLWRMRQNAGGVGRWGRGDHNREIWEEEQKGNKVNKFN